MKQKKMTKKGKLRGVPSFLLLPHCAKEGLQIIIIIISILNQAIKNDYTSQGFSIVNVEQQ